MAAGRISVSQTPEKDTIQYVCEQCGRIHTVEQAEPENAADQWKLAALAAGGIVLLLILWFWVFKWGVPLVQHVRNIE